MIDSDSTIQFLLLRWKEIQIFSVMIEIFLYGLANNGAKCMSGHWSPTRVHA